MRWERSGLSSKDAGGKTADREARVTPTGMLLPGLQQDANTPTSVKVRAAGAIFNGASKAIEIDIDARVDVVGARCGFRRRLSHADPDRLTAELERIVGLSMGG
jgi:hypothetical protein